MKNERAVISPLLHLARINKAYGETTVLQDVSLNMATGIFAAVVGGSGAGKSTLLRTANGLIWPDEGSVTFDGTLLAKNNIVAMRRRIGFVFQATRSSPACRSRTCRSCSAAVSQPPVWRSQLIR